MQVTIKQVSQLVKASREVSDALAVAAQKTNEVAQALRLATSWLEEQYDGVLAIGEENSFGEVQTNQSWADDRARYNVALVEVARIETVLGLDQ